MTVFRDLLLFFEGFGRFSRDCCTSSSRRSLGTVMTCFMTFLKCWKAMVDSKTSFIHLPKRACACRAPASSCHSGTRLCLRLRFAGQFIIRQTPSDNLAHDDNESFRIGQLAVVKTEALLIGVGLQMKRLHAHI